MVDRLKFGYFTLTDNSVGYAERRRDPGELIKEVVNQAIAAEALGYNSAWLPEHHFGFFGVLPTPATVLLPCTQPVRTAEEYAVLDVLSEGRAIFSAGRGYDEREYKGFEIPFAESRTRFDEELLIVRKAWTEENWTFRGGEIQGAFDGRGIPRFARDVLVFHVYRRYARGQAESARAAALLPDQLHPRGAAGSRENAAPHSLLRRHRRPRQAHEAGGSGRAEHRHGHRRRGHPPVRAGRGGGHRGSHLLLQLRLAPARRNHAPDAAPLARS